MLLDTYFYHLPRAIPSHTCEDIIKFGKSLNPEEGKTAASKNMLSDEEKKKHTNEIRNSKASWIRNDRDSWVLRELSMLLSMQINLGDLILSNTKIFSFQNIYKRSL